MHLHSSGGDSELDRDLLITKASGKERKDLLLAWGRTQDAFLTLRAATESLNRARLNRRSRPFCLGVERFSSLISESDGANSRKNRFAP